MSYVFAPSQRGFAGWIMAALCALALLQGCGGGGSSSDAQPVASASPPESGEVVIGVTDAPGDFLLYSVSLQSLTLTRANGDVVETLPLSTRIDFAELVEVTELLTIATVPAGEYRSATVRLDFSDAQVIVEDNAGIGAAAQLQDTEGEPLGTVEMQLHLTTSDVVRVAPGRPAAFSLDFDLDASNTIDLSGAQPVVTVEPFLLATPELETDREHRVRGVLGDVRPDASTFDVVVRPFRHRDGRFGEITVFVDDATEFEIDGQGYRGRAGLDALAELPNAAPVVVQGTVRDQGFAAGRVLAGNSVPWSDADAVVGVVTARVDDVLTVHGAAVEFMDGTRAYRDVLDVRLTEDTRVAAPGIDDASLTIDSVSVGQRVVAWGEFSDDVVLVAGRVHMRMNQLTGEVLETPALAVNLYRLNGRAPERFDFSGTGLSEDSDADPDHYQIDIGALGLANLEASDVVRVRGLVNGFGIAPPDFIARTVVNLETDARAARLWVGWDGGTTQPFVSVDPARLVVDLRDARKSLQLAGVPMGNVDDRAELALIAPESGSGVYAVRVRGRNEFHVYRSFESLVDELTSQLDAGRTLHRITAQGRYNSATDALIVSRAGFVFGATAAGS